MPTAELWISRCDCLSGLIAVVIPTRIKRKRKTNKVIKNVNRKVPF